MANNPLIVIDTKDEKHDEVIKEYAEKLEEMLKDKKGE